MCVVSVYIGGPIHLLRATVIFWRIEIIIKRGEEEVEECEEEEA